MTRIDFYTNVADKAGLTASLLTEALQKQRQATLHVENAAAAAQTSDDLWQNTNTSFLPNMLENHPLAVETPVRLNDKQKDLLRELDQSLKDGKNSPQMKSFMDRVKNFFQ